jgi:erythromycin esterase
MSPDRRLSRRQFVAVASAASASAIAGCSGGDTANESTTTGETIPSTDTAAPTERPTTGPETTTESGSSALLTALDAAAVPVDLADPSGGLNRVADTVATAPVVGIGENSHGAREFKTIPRLLVRRLVADHGYRLVAMEGTLGDFTPVNTYVTGESDDLDAAMADLDFYFWQTPEIRALFEWLRTFNDGRPAADQVVVHGYDAQFHDVNAAALRDYFERVDPEYLATVEDRLDPLTEPLYRQSDASFMTDEQTALLADLRERLQANEAAYVEASSRAEWELAKRHVWTMEKGLAFFAAAHEGNYTEGKTIRDAAMAENVAWLREWTDTDRAVVLGNSNHTMRGATGSDGAGARMGEHLAEKFGEDYYSLGMLFGTGRFRAPESRRRRSFATYDLGEPTAGTLAPTLVDVSHPQFFLDLDGARDRAEIETWLSDTTKTQFSVPNAADRGSLGLPAAPGDVYDGFVFVHTVSPATFSTE